MTNATKFATVSVLALMLAQPAFAQAIVVGAGGVDDQIEDIERDVAADFARSEDEGRFGNPEFRTGLSGSASLSYTGSTGNTESQDLAIGARLRYASGNFVQSLGMAIEFSDEAGVATTEDVFGVYDANYYLNDKFYVFALGRVKTDGLADVAIDPTTTYATDAYIGVGPGYRVVNTEQMTWRVQAGVGFSYLETGDGVKSEEVGYLLASRFFYKINDNLFLTDDTDILSSDTALRVNNDFGVNIKMTDAFSTRVSYLSEYNDSRAIKTDNKVGVALVYGF